MDSKRDSAPDDEGSARSPQGPTEGLPPDATGGWAWEAARKSPNPIFTVDAAGIIQNWNAGCEAVFGYREDEIAGQRYSRLLLDPADRAALDDMIAGAFAGQVFSDVDVSFRSRDGDTRYVSSRLFLVDDPAGDVSMCVFANTDMTERRQVEETLKRRQRELDSLLEVSRSLLGVLELDKLMSAIAHTALRLLNADECTIYRLELGGQTLRAIVSLGEFADEVMTNPVSIGSGISGACARQREPILANDAQDDPRAEHIPDTPTDEREHVIAVPLIVRDELFGVMFVNRVDKQPFTTDDLQLCVGYGQHAAIALQNAQLYGEAQAEISRRRRVEAVLRESEERFRTAFRTSPDSISISRLRNGLFVDINDGFTTLTGYTREEVIGRTSLEIDIWASPAERQRLVEGLERDGTVTNLESQFRLKDGSLRTALVSARIITLVGEPHLLSIARDISELKQAQDALAQAAQRLSILHQIDRAILSAESPQAIATAAVTRIQEIIPCRRATVVAFDETYTNLRFLALYDNGRLASEPLPTLLVAETYTSLDDLHAGNVRTLADLTAVPLPSRVERQLIESGIRSVNNIPLVTHGELIGVLNIGLDRAGGLSADHLEIAIELSNQLVLSIQQAHLFEAEQEQRVLAEALSDSAAAINSSLVLSEVLERVLDNIGRVVPHDAANIMLVEAGVARIVGRRGYVERGLDEAVLSARYTIDDTPNLRQMLDSGTGVVIVDTRSDPNWVRIDQTVWIGSYVGAPIRLEGRTLGFINLDAAAPDFFTPRHAERLQAFTDQVAVVIRNAQLYEAEQKRRQAAESLQHAAAALNSSLELDEVLGQILQQLGSVVHYDSASIQQVENGDLQIIAQRGLPESVLGLRFAIGPKYPNARVVTERRSLAIEDVTREYPHFHSEASYYQSGHIRSWLGVPLLVKDRLIGMITLDRQQVWPYTDEDVAIVTAIANQAAVAIENARLLQSLRERATRLELLEQAGRSAAALLDLDELLHHAVDLIGEAFGYYLAEIMLVEGDGLILKAATRPDVREMEGVSRLDAGTSSIIGWVARTGEALLVNDTSQEPRFHYFDKAPDTRSELTVPIMFHDELIGVLDVQSDRVGTFTAADQSTLQVIADQLATAIHNAQLYAQVQRHAAEMEERVTERTAELETANKRLQELSRVKDEFVSNVSHELRTPIASIKLYHDLLDRNPDKQSSYMATLRRETERLERVVEELLYLSRLDQGRMAYMPGELDLNRLVASYVGDRRLLAQSQGLTLSFETAPGLPAVWVDEALIGQALSVLLTNAITYTPPGGTITVRTQTNVVDGVAWAGVSVADTGHGISREEMPHLFDRFYRGRVGRDSGAGGTGLGLAIAREIAMQHRGRIDVTSEGVPGKGSTFTLWLPSMREAGDR